ncbi:FAD-dependent oxidoreductase [Ktedonobacter sp. SOSP1-52]|uniref:FAD-dependent oxidoreductase n=1 Tax=Ktedonobacter sp. SOSP1-52 TaxID=2778366 RepID=UPI0035B4C6AF
MQQEAPAARRAYRSKELQCDLVIIGGGMSGVCAAVTATRAGVKVTLVQDRPVLGGNASSEVRLWVLGATSHMGNNNRWAREGGVLDELLVENLYRNPEGNAIIFDTILLEKVTVEPNITLLLNTALIDITKTQPDRIDAIQAFCSQNSTMYHVHAPLFCDASGDGALAFLAGAAFRMGAESRQEFDEGFAPDAEYGDLLGHSIYFYSKDVGKPVTFMPPAYALEDITRIPRFRSFNTKDYGCRLWWMEYGGRLDTVHDTETIKWELWKTVYGVWNYIKNSGKFPEAETLTLEWVGSIPGKRESRRFEGDYMLNQRDIVEQRHHHDAIAFGGWSIDLHPADGVFSERPGCSQWHARGVYQIPYRCLYSRNVHNLFLTGRIMSASHVAFGSSRVMATCAYAAQAAGMAAGICMRQNLLPAALSETEYTRQLQRDLMRSGQHIPGFRLDDPDDLVKQARISASSELRLAELPTNGPLIPLTSAWAQMLPIVAGPMPTLALTADVAEATTLRVELRTSDRPDNYTPDVMLGALDIALEAGAHQEITVNFPVTIDEPRYVFLCAMRNKQVALYGSEHRLTGILSAKYSRTQEPAEDIGVETFEMWQPQRRPGGYNFALHCEPPLTVFSPTNVANGIARPTSQPNAWVAALNDSLPTLELRWEQPQCIRRIELAFDTDFDHPMESVLMGHPERVMPFCVKHYRLCAGEQLIAENTDNHQTRNTITLKEPITTDCLSIHLLKQHGEVPAALFEIRCYAE